MGKYTATAQEGHDNYGLQLLKHVGLSHPTRLTPRPAEVLDRCKVILGWMVEEKGSEYQLQSWHQL